MKMRMIFGACCFFLLSLPLAAQENNEKNEFKPYWFMQIQGGVAHTVGEASFSKLLSPAAAISGGYYFNPVLGLRIGVSGWESKGNSVLTQTTYKYKYLAGNADLMINLSNLICRYNPQRITNFYGFVGFGLNHAFDNEAEDINFGNYTPEYLWHDSKNFLLGRGGLGVNFRLGSNICFNIEANANVLSDKYNSKKADNADWYFNALAGFTFRFGKSGKKVEEPYIPPVQQEQPAPKEEPKKEVVTTPVVKKEEPKKVEPYRCDIFFKINQSTVRESEATKLAELASFLNNNPQTKVIITGYADKGTGNAYINNRISEARAKAVTKILTEKHHIDAARITTEHKGDTVQPFAENNRNRVTICIAE